MKHRFSYKEQKQKNMNKSKKNNDNCLQYPIMVALNQEQIKDLQRITKITPFIISMS